MKFFSVAAALSLASTAYSQTSKICPSDASGACYQVNVPSNTSTSGKGDIFFQLSAPSSLQWVGFGEGQQMAGSNIFVMYASADGKNVTISPRSGVGEVMPKFNPSAEVTLLEGSGISNGMMTANVKCSNCESWKGGELDVKSSTADWIYAVKEGTALKTDDKSAMIVQHDVHGQVQIDLTKATGGSTMNPFVGAAASPSPSTPPTSPSSGGAMSGSSSSGDSSSSMSMRSRVVIAHGTIMGLAFVIFFPLGALTIRVLRMKGLVWVHAGSQIFAYTVALAGFGLGVWIAVTGDDGVKGPHQIIGIIVIALLLFQPALGLIHHRLYVKTQRKTVWALSHVWLGRGLLILGMINGGLGLRLAANTTKGEIAYGVVAGVVGVSYIGIVLAASLRGRGRQVGQGETGEKLTGGNTRSPTEGSTTPPRA
ncbi:MAG: hypothetical protein M4579_004194 [Chaenotheca gracillima]|nr:MAG: hypothetical protein M4579_004194 [Chaenotheca gracillima]